MNVDVVTDALSNSTHRIMSKRYMTAGLGDAGACHPRDNIALRYMSDKLGLGYDLFDAIMLAREIQAENMAKKCLEYGKNVTIIGKAYKPSVPYTNGSASMLVGYYVEKHGGTVNYFDINTGDTDLKKEWSQVYLIGYWEPYVEQAVSNIPAQAVIIDPWRKLTVDDPTKVEVIHYGNTRKKKVN
jgi:UDPglucose 6-dehydrogenase